MNETGTRCPLLLQYFSMKFAHNNLESLGQQSSDLFAFGIHPRVEEGCRKAISGHFMVKLETVISQFLVYDSHPQNSVPYLFPAAFLISTYHPLLARYEYMSNSLSVQLAMAWCGVVPPLNRVTTYMCCDVYV